MALARQPQFFEGYVNRSVGRLARGVLLSLAGGDPGSNCKEAFEDLNQAVRIRKTDIMARLHRSNVLLFSARYARDQGKDVRGIFELAQKDLDDAVSFDSMSATAFHNRGIVHFYLASLDKRQQRDSTDQIEKAIQDLEKATSIDPTCAYAYKDLGVCRVALARMLLARGERPRDFLKKALGDLTLALEGHPRMYGAYYERGMAFFSLKQFEEAGQDWAKCLQIDPAKKGQLEPLIQDARQRAAEQTPEASA